MKNWKNYGIISFLIFLMLSFILNSCEDEKSCDCIVKEHLGINENCCNGKNCNCSEQIDYIVGIKIRKFAGISLKDMEEIVQKINLAYQNISVTPGAQEALAEKVGLYEIHIVPENTIPYDVDIQGFTVIIGINARQMDINGILMGLAFIPI